tara:strand:+ start:354 stop:1115 length:762 start_codon:yes stop_codon:yes gene_type:complete
MNELSIPQFNLTSGQKAALSSAVQSCVTYPIDTALKQKQAGKTIKHILTYSGFSASLINYPLSRYIGFEVISKFEANPRTKNMATIYGSVLSGIIKPIIIYPLDIIKIQFQTRSAKTYHDVSVNIKKIPLPKHKLAIYFLQMRSITGYLSWFQSQKLYKTHISNEQTLTHNTASGALSALTVAITIQPFEVGKINNQIGNFSSLTSLLKQHGIGRFYSYSYFGITLARNLINGIIFNNCFELLNKQSSKKDHN